MKTFLISIICLFVFSSCSNNDKYKNSLEELNLKGDIEFIKEFGFLADNIPGNPQRGERIRLANQWDRTYFNDKGNITSAHNYSFDDPEFETGFVRYHYDDKDKLIEKQYLISKDKRYVSKNDVRYLFYYNNKGYLSEETFHNADGSLNYRADFSYDENGNLIKVNYYESDGKVNLTLTFEYQDDGKLNKNKAYNSDGELKGSRVYYYDDNGDVFRERNYDSDNNLMSSSVEYDYTYDLRGNWVKKIIYENNSPKFIIVRGHKYKNTLSNLFYDMFISK